MVYFKLGIWRKPTYAPFFPSLPYLSFLFRKFLSYLTQWLFGETLVFHIELDWNATDVGFQILMRAALRLPPVTWKHIAKILYSFFLLINKWESALCNTQIKLSCISNYEFLRKPPYSQFFPFHFLICHFCSENFSLTWLIDCLYSFKYLIFILTKMLLMWVSDINECSFLPFPCHVNAQCNNTIGSYGCACNRGYAGNGKSCTGT